MKPTAGQRRLSVAIVVRDAAEALRATLDNVRSTAQEVVVIDTGSTDDTREVAGECGATVVKHAWADDFAAARNAGWRAATGDWILWLDAGEQLVDANCWREFLDHQAYAKAAHAVLVQVPPLGPSGTVEQIAQVRLFPRHDGLAFTGRVRESAVPSVMPAGLYLDSAPLCIRRGVREHDPQRKSARARRNLRLAEMELREGGRRPELFNCLGDALQTLRQYPRAGDSFRQALVSSVRGSAEMLEAYYGLLTSLDDGTNRRTTQIALCTKALEVFPLDAQLLCAMGQYLQAEAQIELAAKSYRTAAEHGQINAAVWHVAEIHDLAAICLSHCLHKLQQESEAIVVLQAAVARNPHSERLHRQLLDVHVQRGNVDEAVAQIEQLSASATDGDVLIQVVRAAALAARHEWLAAASILEAAYGAGCRDPLCLRWLGLARLHRGDLTAARAVLAEWQRLDPPNAEVARILQMASAAEADRSAA
jgi:tetratricopeptide (TPR) repeat protein